MKKLLLFVAALLTAMAVNAATFSVTVPSGTKAVYLCGDGSSWGHVEMVLNGTTATYSDAATWTEYKYCSGPDWKYVEKDEFGEEMSNRSYTDGIDVVATWAAIYDPGASHTYSTVEVLIQLSGENEVLIWDWAGGSKRTPGSNDSEGQTWPGTRAMDLTKASGWAYFKYDEVEDGELSFKLIADGGESAQFDTDGSAKYCRSLSDPATPVTCPEITPVDEIGAESVTGVQKIIDAVTGERYILKANGEKVNF